MKIGLARHFKVQFAYPKMVFIPAETLRQWFVNYNTAAIIPAPVDLHGVDWKHCYCSKAERAIITAQTIFKGEIQSEEALNELNVLPLLPANRRRPLLLWALQMRNLALQENAITDAFRQRLFAFLDQVLKTAEGDILIVSHGFVMMHLQKELRKRGFAGKGFRSPKNGKVYVFER